eukprot:5956203-Amphidinium_carterae.1
MFAEANRSQEAVAGTAQRQLREMESELNRVQDERNMSQQQLALESTRNNSLTTLLCCEHAARV